MGMFDYVEHAADCEVCGKPLTDFQSKDGVCELQTLQPKDVDYFYSYCGVCGTRHDFYVDRECVCTVNSIKAYAKGESLGE